MDEYRHAIERMEPRHYMSASYYERTFTAVASLCVERGLFTSEELSAAAGFPIALSLPSQPGRIAPSDLPAIEVGDRVRVKDEFVPGHIRMPGYIRGKTGVVVSESPPYPFPDAHGHGLQSPWQRSFDVRFSSQDLWPDGAEDAEVNVGVFHAYLEKTS
jgi:nitrile hydratase